MVDSTIRYLEFRSQVREAGAGKQCVGTRHVVELAFLLVKQSVPTFDRSGFDQLRHAERQGAHEVVTRGPIPVPDLERQSPAVVFGARDAYNANVHTWIEEQSALSNLPRIVTLERPCGFDI